MFIDRINKNPVRFHVTVTRPSPGADQGVVFVLRWQLFPRGEEIDKTLHPGQVLASFPHAFEVFEELICLENRFHSTPGFKEGVKGIEISYIFAGGAFLQNLSAQFIGNFNGERDPAVQGNLPVKKSDRLRGAHSQPG